MIIDADVSIPSGSADLTLIRSDGVEDTITVQDGVNTYDFDVAYDESFEYSTYVDANSDITDAIDINSLDVYTLVAPSGLTVTANYETADLAWVDESDNEDEFVIYRGTTSGDLTEVATVSANTESYTDTGLTNATTYYYEVTARRSTTESAPSNQITITTDIRAPSNLTVTQSDTDQFEIDWVLNDNTDAGQHEVHMASAVSPTWPDDYSIESTPPLTSTGVWLRFSPGTYHFRIVRTANGQSAQSSISQGTLPFYVNVPVSGTGSVDNERIVTKDRVLLTSGNGVITNTRVRTLQRDTAVTGSGSIDNSRKVVYDRTVSASGDGSIDNTMSFRAVFQNTLLRSYKWDYDQDLEGFVSDWIYRDASDDHGTVSLYIRGTFGRVDPASPTVKLYFDETGDGNIDQESDMRSIYTDEEPVTFPRLDGNSGYYRILLKDLRPSDVITRVIFGPGHT